MEGAAPVSLGCSAVLSLLEVDAAVKVDESVGRGLLQDACAGCTWEASGEVAVLEVVMVGGRVDR